MENKTLGCTLFTIAAVILALATFGLINKEKFTEMRFDTKMDGGVGLQETLAIENYQRNIVQNVGTSVDDVNQQGSMYYTNLQNFLAPGRQNLELASNISSRPVQGGINLPGAAESYTDNLGNGYVSYLGHLKGQGAFPPVAYENDRAAQLSKCAKDLPMFAASSLLPKPSSNADNNALAQSAARALGAFTNLSPVEQIGAITSTNLPLNKVGEFRAPPQISQQTIMKNSTPMFYSSPALYISPTYGSFNSTTGAAGPNNVF